MINMLLRYDFVHIWGQLGKRFGERISEIHDEFCCERVGKRGFQY